MYQTSRVVLVLCGVVLLLAPSKANINSKSLNLDLGNIEYTDVYATMLKDIQKEQSFESILVIRQKSADDVRLKTFYQFDIPKVIWTTAETFVYEQIFNSNMLTVIIMSHAVDRTLMQTTAQTLDYIRQSRILIVALSVADCAGFQRDLLELLEKYKMTNVLLSFTHPLDAEVPWRYYMLKPYPNYRWHSTTLLGNRQAFYPTHWRNMHNKTLMTYPDQYAPLSLVFVDQRGQLKLSGYVVRLVTLFAQHYNAHLEMYEPLQVGKAMHFTAFTRMTQQGLLDIPMSMDNGLSGQWKNISSPFETIPVMVMVPLAQPLTINEVFAVLLDGYFLGSIIMFSVALSVVHSLIDYYFEGIWQRFNFVINDKVFPGILGQPHAVRNSHLISLKMVYFFIGFAGLNLSTQFSANVNTLLTTPSYHPQIERFSDLRNSPLKMLIEVSSAKVNNDWVIPSYVRVVFTNDSVNFLKTMQSFNTSYCYVIRAALWNIYNRRQNYFSRKAFHVPKAMYLHSIMSWGIRLQFNSPYKEALNQLIHRIQDAGLIDAWYASTYGDMLQLKRVPLHDPNPERGSRIFTADELFWVWMVVVIGWASSTLAFVVELWMGRGSNY